MIFCGITHNFYGKKGGPDFFYFFFFLDLNGPEICAIITFFCLRPPTSVCERALICFSLLHSYLFDLCVTSLYYFPNFTKVYFVKFYFAEFT